MRTHNRSLPALVLGVLGLLAISCTDSGGDASSSSVAESSVSTSLDEAPDSLVVPALTFSGGCGNGQFWAGATDGDNDWLLVVLYREYLSPASPEPVEFSFSFPDRRIRADLSRGIQILNSRCTDEEIETAELLQEWQVEVGTGTFSMEGQATATKCVYGRLVLQDATTETGLSIPSVDVASESMGCPFGG